VEYLRRVDPEKFDMTRFSVQTLAGRESGSERCLFRVARVPAGSVATEEPHIHAMDKFYFILGGVMSLEIEKQRYDAGPNTLIFVPAGVPHRNWNEGSEPEVHIVLFVPEPAPGEQLVLPVPAES